MKREQIIVVDVETTGSNVLADQVIEFAYQLGLDVPGDGKCFRIKPSVPINLMAERVHGISAEDVASCPPFSHFATTIREIINSAEIIVGYNVQFDIDILQSEFKRTKEPVLDLSNKIIIDALRVWRVSEPRKLENAVERFAMRKHINAHSAVGDIEATAEVLKGMIKEFGLSGMSWKELAMHSDPERALWVGTTNHLLWVGELAVINFGKYRGLSLQEVQKKDKSYFRWILEQDFPDDVREVAKEALNKSDDKLSSWVLKRFGRGESEADNRS